MRLPPDQPAPRTCNRVSVLASSATAFPVIIGAPALPLGPRLRARRGRQCCCPSQSERTSVMSPPPLVRDGGAMTKEREETVRDSEKGASRLGLHYDIPGVDPENVALFAKIARIAGLVLVVAFVWWGLSAPTGRPSKTWRRRLAAGGGIASRSPTDWCPRFGTRVVPSVPDREPVFCRDLWDLAFARPAFSVRLVRSQSSLRHGPRPHGVGLSDASGLHALHEYANVAGIGAVASMARRPASHPRATSTRSGRPSRLRFRAIRSPARHCTDHPRSTASRPAVRRWSASINWRTRRGVSSRHSAAATVGTVKGRRWRWFGASVRPRDRKRKRVSAGTHT